MFKTKTAFIIGAGASKEFDLLLGSELAKKIASMCDVRFDDWGGRCISGDAQLFESFKLKFPRETQEYHRAALAIRDGIPLQNSIDDFLHANRSNEKIVSYGKAAIVKAVIEMEHGSKIFYDNRKSNSSIKFYDIEKTYLNQISKILFSGCSLEAAEKIFENCIFIVFNYDRCVEHFLFNAIQRFYQIDDAKTYKIYKKSKVIHPYGCVGSLPFQYEFGNIVPFGGSNYGQHVNIDYIDAANSIRLYTEDNKDHLNPLNISRELSQCQNVVFLGFGFHRQNIEILWPEHRNRRMPYIIATNLGVSPDNMKMISYDLISCFDTGEAATFKEKFHPIAATCGDVVADYALRLGR